MTKITNLPLAAIIAGTLVALAAGPAFANPPSDAIDKLVGTLESLQAGIDDLRNLLEPKTIFVSSTDHTGDLGGLAGADLICQGLADALGSIVPEGEYVALLSDGDVNAAARLTPSSGPYVRPDGVPVAANFAALFAPVSSERARDLINPVFTDEMGDIQIDEVWTGSQPSGVADENGLDFCLDLETLLFWNSGAGDVDGQAGRSEFKHGEWLSLDPAFSCDTWNRLYCVQR